MRGMYDTLSASLSNGEKVGDEMVEEGRPGHRMLVAGVWKKIPAVARIGGGNGSS